MSEMSKKRINLEKSGKTEKNLANELIESSRKTHTDIFLEEHEVDSRA